MELLSDTLIIPVRTTNCELIKKIAIQTRGKITGDIKLYTGKLICDFGTA